MRLVLAVLLLGEAALTAVWLAGRMPMLPVYDSLVLTMVGLRTAVATVQSTAGLMWVRRLPPAPLFTRWALLASAALLTLELGAGLSPTSMFPAFRWPAVAAYWVYAAGVIGLLRIPSRARPRTLV
jgi:hypothetical protein